MCKCKPVKDLTRETLSAPVLRIPYLALCARWSRAQDILGLVFARVSHEDIGLGFIVGKHAYLRDAWNYLDFVVVITGVLDFLPSDYSSSNLSSLRALRVRRPLRMVNKFPQLRETVR